MAKRVAKALARDLPAVAPVLNGAVSELAGAGSKLEFNTEEVEEMVQDEA